MEGCIEKRISIERILPSELISEILTRLPADSAIQCRQVCKTWKDLLSQPSFAQAHLRQQLSKLNGNNSYTSLSSHTAVGLLFSFAFTLERGNQLYYGEYGSQTRNKLRKINQPPTVEYVNLPLAIKRDSIVGYDEFIVCGFGYHPSTDKYKIVKIHYTKTTHLGRVEVYTIGSGSGWRVTGTTSYSLRPSESAEGTFGYETQQLGTLANGALHWLNKEGEIV
ncbi:hypothetical protein MKW94_019253, partial [Papaver nudicaule]|nr:hypothetical protein [Papaver nudicaule]